MMGYRMNMILLIAFAAIVSFQENIENSKPPKIVDYNDGVADLGVDDLERGIECLSANIVTREDQRFIVVSVLLKEKVYTGVDTYFVELLPNPALERIGRFSCISESVLLDHNGIRMPAFFGLLKFEAEVDFISDEVNKSEEILQGEVAMELCAKMTSAKSKRKFALFLDEWE